MSNLGQNQQNRRIYRNPQLHFEHLLTPDERNAFREDLLSTQIRNDVENLHNRRQQLARMRLLNVSHVRQQVRDLSGFRSIQPLSRHMQRYENVLDETSLRTGSRHRDQLMTTFENNLRERQPSRPPSPAISYGSDRLGSLPSNVSRLENIRAPNQATPEQLHRTSPDRSGRISSRGLIRTSRNAIVDLNDLKDNEIEDAMRSMNIGSSRIFSRDRDTFGDRFRGDKRIIDRDIDPDMTSSSRRRLNRESRLFGSDFDDLRGERSAFVKRS